ncbi:putative BRCT domain-containing protein [Dioscorea sansibarensis]
MEPSLNMFKTIDSSQSDQTDAGKNGTRPDESELRLAQLQHQLPRNEPGALMQMVEDATSKEDDDDDDGTKDCKCLFKNMKFFLSREVPRESLLFVIPAFGGVVSWDGDGSPFSEADEISRIRLLIGQSQGHLFLSRVYVQPQWVYDCVNARMILPTEPYAVGRVPPPHLSPFVDNEAEGYVPEYAETIKRLKAAAEKQVLPLPGAASDELDNPQNLLVEGVIDRAEAIEAAEKKRKLSMLEKQYRDELNMELKGINYSASLSIGGSSADNVVEEDANSDLEQIAGDAQNRSKISMSRKKRKIYEAMQISKQRKKANVHLLKEKKEESRSARENQMITFSYLVLAGARVINED